MKKNNFLSGAAILAVAGLFVKIIGAVYRIPLQNIITLEGMAKYSVAYSVYAVLLTISSAGIPSAISKMISERIAIDDMAGARGIIRQSFKLLTIVGTGTMLLMFIFAKPYADANSIKGSYLPLMALAPSLLFVSLISVYRGYFQGMQNMTPTAVSQVVEQLGKLLIGFTAASRMMKYGTEYGAMGAILGVTAGELMALVLLMGYYMRKRRDEKRAEVGFDVADVSLGSVTKVLLAIAVPITIGASIMPLVQFVDTIIVPARLIGIGFSQDAAAKAFALLVSSVNPLINMPAVLTLSLCMSLVPAISTALMLRKANDIRQATSMGIKLAICIGLPCAVGFFVLAKPILSLLFRTSLIGADLDVAAELLRVMSIGVIFLSLVQSVTGILQGLGKPVIAVGNLAVGAVFKVIISFVLIGIPHINIIGATVGSVVCYATAGILDTIIVFRKTNTPFSWRDFIIKPVIAALMMGAFAYYAYHVLFEHMLGSTIGLLVTILIAAVIYGSALLLTKALSKEDYALIPGGSRLYELLCKAGIYDSRREAGR